jgi:hypothetical protein
LKLDTQGWDLEVMRGAAGCLPLVRTLQIELPIKPIYDGMTTYAEAMAMLNREGFVATGVFPVSRTDQLHLVEIDCVMAR